MGLFDVFRRKKQAPKFDAEPLKDEARLHAVPTVRGVDGKVKVYQEYFVTDEGSWSARVYGVGGVLEHAGSAADRRAASMTALAWCERAKAQILGG